MDPFSPATPPATKQGVPSSTQQPAEDEVAASLLMLKEADGPESEGETALQEDKENHLVPDESTSTVDVHRTLTQYILLFFSFQWCKKPQIYLFSWLICRLGVKFACAWKLAR
jgi:hypothetical protein